MKKVLLFSVLAVAMLSTVASAQTLNILYGDRASNVVDVIQVTAWTPWLSGSDSTTVKYYSGTDGSIDISGYDSIRCWIYESSVNGVPKNKGTLQSSFDGTNFTLADSASKVLWDTTQAKTEALTLYSTANIGTNGALKARVRVMPFLNPSTGNAGNMSDTIIRFYLICHKRGHIITPAW